MTDDEVNALISKLQELVPQLQRRPYNTAGTSKILKQVCNYIKRLQKEVDDLSERLSHLLDPTDTDASDHIRVLRSILQH